jgi:membrane protease YdiL (CAAX protease family)
VGRWAVSIAWLVLMQLPWPAWLFPGNTIPAQMMREAAFWVMAACLLFYLARIERTPLSSIGLVRPGWRTLAFGVAGAAVTVAGIALIYIVVFPMLGVPQEAQMNEIAALPLWLRLAIVTRAAVFEEIFYRGFAIERITELTGSRRLAALVSLAAFTFAHLQYWGWAHLLVAAFGGAVLTLMYLFRRDLGANMLAHWLTDAVGFLLG